MIPGKIRITDKVYFEYYKLKLPAIHKVGRDAYFKAMDKYEASKQLIEVENISYVDNTNKIFPFINNLGGVPTIENNQRCKAEVIGDKAEIVELIKE